MITTVALSTNEPVLPTKVAQLGTEGIIAVLPPGQTVANSSAFRAMSVNIPDANAAGGLIVAGDHVDLLYTLGVVEPTRTDFVGRIVIQDIPVLAKTITVYTLRVDATTAERIAALQASGGATSAAASRAGRRATRRHRGRELHDRGAADPSTLVAPITPPAMARGCLRRMPP